MHTLFGPARFSGPQKIATFSGSGTIFKINFEAGKFEKKLSWHPFSGKKNVFLLLNLPDNRAIKHKMIRPNLERPRLLQ